MGSNIFGSALSGMNAAQYGLATTQHNIANANTPGFSRQVIDQQARPGQQTGAGFLGQGVDVVGVRRLYDQFISTQVLQEQTQATYLTTYHTAISEIDNLLADSAAGASPAMQQFFDSLNGVANSPESIPARQTLLGNAQFAVNRFQAIDQRLTDITTSLNGQLTNGVTTINSYAQQIAALNANIKRAAANAGPGQMPNDLLDQRDQLINLLSKEVKASVQSQSNGAVNVFIGNGQGLVVDEQAYSLTTLQSTSDPSKLDIGFQYQGNSIVLPQSSLQGGNMGAYLTFRDQTLEPARNALGRVALGLATSMNQQNQMGQDLTGALGGNLFTVAAPRVSNGANNNGTATLTASIADVGALTTSDYQLRFDGTNYTMLRLSDNAVTNLGTTLPLTPGTIDGFSFNLTAGASGMMKGDTFLIRPTADGARDIAVAITDPAKIAAAAPIRGNATVTNTGTGTISAGTVNTPLPLNPNLQATVTIAFNSATTFTVSGAVPAVTGSVAYTPGGNISYNGWTVQINGTPAVGDSFTVQKNTNATGDNRNALLMVGLQNKSILANGTASFQGAYGQLVGQIGAKTNELSVTSTAQTSMLNETIKQQQSVSGVNLDEEAANLLRYQRAYEAAAQALKIANTMFDTLLALR
ncbi:MAG TPA: flagellar hook-associated protein FlgK [Gallionella sp.]|nr:flagellar hook-associated protein FlgK [Gallionella sp.]